MQKILLLGASGSIGQSAVNCVKRYPYEFELTGISFNSRADLGKECLKTFRSVKSAAITCLDTAKNFPKDIFGNVKFYD